MSDSRSGNILFLILIAVALFAALAYIVSTSSRSGSGSVTKESTALLAGQILNQIETFHTSIQRIIITGDCADEQLNAYTSVYRYNSGAYIHTFSNNLAPADGHCNLFGGPNSLPVLYAPAEAFVKTNVATEAMTGHYGFVVKRINNVGNVRNDIVVMLTNLRMDLCLYFLDKFNLNSTSVPTDNHGSAQIGATATPLANPIGDDAPELAGLLTFVVTTTTSTPNSCMLVSVLAPR